MTGVLGGLLIGSTNTASAQEDPTIEWTRGTPFQVSSSPTVVDGTVYGMDRDGWFFAIDVDSGEDVWVKEIEESGRGLSGSPHVVDGFVYVATEEAGMICFDAETGDREWSFEPDATFQFHTPTVVDGTVYVSSSEEIIFAVDADTGDEDWRIETHGHLNSELTIDDGIIYTEIDEDLVGYSTDDGEEIVRVETEYELDGPVTVVDGVAYCTTTEGIAALDHDEVLWMTELPGRGGAQMPTVVGNTVYMLGGTWVDISTYHLFALDVDDGEILWEEGVGQESLQEMTIADGTIYFPDTEGYINAYDSESGDELWRFEVGENIYDSNPIVVDGMLFIGTDGDAAGRDPGSIVALDIGGTATSSDSRTLQSVFNHHDGWTGDSFALTYDRDAVDGDDIPIDDDGALVDGRDDDGIPGFGVVGAITAVMAGVYGLKHHLERR